MLPSWRTLWPEVRNQRGRTWEEQMALSYTGKKKIRKSFGKIPEA